VIKQTAYIKTLAIIAMGIATCASSWAQGLDPIGYSRAGVLLPQDVQLSSAVQAAARVQDAPLDQPSVGLTLPNEAILVTEQEPSEIEQDIQEALDPVTLEERIQQQVVQRDIEQFGYDIFSLTPTTFAPVESIPVPPDYSIGPGDTFVIRVFGAIDVEYRLVVTRDGALLVPEIGELQLAGLTFSEAKTLISNEIASARVGAKAIVTLAELHTLQVLMVGEVPRPGTYTISGLSTLLNTLITTGGVKRSGSLRNIQVRREGNIIATLDIYNVLLKGYDKDNVHLRQGDIVFVPPIGPTVGIAGEVNRPAIYEIKTELTVNEILTLAGGLQAAAAQQKTHIERISDTGSKTLVAADLTSNGGQIHVRNGDMIRIFPVLNKMENVVLLGGHVLEPGGYEWRENMYLSDLLKDERALRQGVDYTTGIVIRESAKTKRTSAIYFNLGLALQRPSSKYDPKLQARDEVIIFDTNSNRSSVVQGAVKKIMAQSTPDNPPSVYELAGVLRHKGVYPLESGTRLLDSLIIGGDIQPGTDLSYALLVRKDPVTEHIEFIQLDLNKARRHTTGDHNPVLQYEDKIYLFDTTTDRASLIANDINKLRKQTQYGESAPIVTLTGKAKFPGNYPLIAGMRLKDLINAGGGLTEDAYGRAVSLSRREIIEGEFSVIDHADVKLTSIAEDGYDANMILQPYDFVVIREKPEWFNQRSMATIEGEVLYPGSYQIQKGETLCSLVRRAGGFTENAYLFGSVFTRESVRKREQDALDRIFDEIDDRLMDVHLSPGYSKDTKLPITKGATDTLRVYQELKRQKAAGRMVIDVENAVNQCQETPDFALEDGDKLVVPRLKEEVSVVGQVYYPSSHMFRDDRAVFDYINLSGGMREFAQHEHVFIVQANGEVVSTRSALSSWGWALQSKNLVVTPGSTIYVPLSLDRINGREFAQSWADLIYKISISAASLDFLFN
jgi:polysaccharide biosynthesis/export protein